MNGKKRNLITNTEAVSGVIGAVLLIAIFVTMFTMIQATVIPDLNRKVEWDHVAEVDDEMSYQKTNIRNVGSDGIQATTDIDLGVRYPNRAIFINPAVGVSGSITIDNPLDVSVMYGTETEPYTSSRIIYELHGEPNLPKIVYEHGSIIWDYENGNSSGDTQTLIEGGTLANPDDDNFYIPIVNGFPSSESGLGVLSLTTYPYDRLYSQENQAPPFEVTLKTNYPYVWKDILLSDTVIDNLDLDDTTTVTVDTGNKEITIRSTATRNLVLPDQTPANMLHAGLISYSTDPIIEYGGGGDGGYLSADLGNDTSDLSWTSSKLSNVVLINNGDAPIIVMFIRVSWVPDNGEELKTIYLNGFVLTAFGNPKAPSGTWFDVRDNSIILYPDDTATFDVEFNTGSVQDKIFTIDFVLNDGSMETVTFSTYE